jgi:hypothetical protein
MLLDMDVYHKLGCYFFLDGLNIDMCEHKYIYMKLEAVYKDCGKDSYMSDMKMETRV